MDSEKSERIDFFKSRTISYKVENFNKQVVLMDAQEFLVLH